MSGVCQNSKLIQNLLKMALKEKKNFPLSVLGLVAQPAQPRRPTPWPARTHWPITSAQPHSSPLPQCTPAQAIGRTSGPAARRALTPLVVAPRP